MLLFHLCHLVRSMVLYFHVDLVVPKSDEIHCLLQCLGSLSDKWAIYCLLQKVVQIGAWFVFATLMGMYLKNL
jgi:hypothetical protein